MTPGFLAARPAPLLVAAVAAALIWFILRNLGLALLTGPAPDKAAFLLPTSPRTMVGQAVGEGLSATTPVKPAATRLLAAGMRNAPLLAEPFFAAAVRNRSMGRLVLATQQMEEASRRDPRVVAPHIFLAEQYMRAGRSRDALARIVVALRLPLSEQDSQGLMRALYLMGRDANGRNALARALAADPPWRRSFIEYVMGQGGDPATLFDAMKSSPAGYGAEKVTDERQIFLNGLVAAKDYERAYLAWVNFLPADAIDRVAPVYDGTFRKLPGPAPFNWTLVSGDSASAEMVDDSPIPPGSALAVNFFGSARTVIASQMLLVPPGDYLLSIAGRGTNEKSMFSGSLVWEVACLPSGATLGRMAFNALGEKPAMNRLALTVPSDCKAQTLTLLGLPGETSIQVGAEFGAISLRPR